MISTIAINPSITTIGNQSGAVTAHHDQYCTGPISANLSVKSIKNNMVPRPIPLPDAF